MSWRRRLSRRRCRATGSRATPPRAPGQEPAPDDRATERRSARSLATQDDRGVVTVFVAVMAAALVFVAGFAFDGGQILLTFTRANNLADAAARAAAQGIDTDQFRASGTVTLDPSDAQARAAAFLADAGHPGVGSVTVSGDEVTVTVTLVHDLRLAPGTRSVTASSTATAVEGVDGPPIGGP